MNRKPAKKKNSNYYVTVEKIVKSGMELHEAKKTIRNYKGNGLLHIRNDGINELRP